MVALSLATARELGYLEASDADNKKGFVEVSGRKGLGVKADDLIDRLAGKALAEVTARNADMPPADAERVARQIAVAAVRYFLVRNGINAARIRTVSYGKERPVAVCNDISCWSQNRRAQTVLNSRHEAKS